MQTPLEITTDGQHRDLAGNSIAQASGGQLQRVGSCRALINEPRILFCVEPTGALDSCSATEIMDPMREVNTWGTTIVLVTHDVRVAARSDRVLFMMDGRITEDALLEGTIEDDQKDRNTDQREEEQDRAVGYHPFPRRRFDSNQVSFRQTQADPFGLLQGIACSVGGLAPLFFGVRDGYDCPSVRKRRVQTLVSPPW